MNAADRYHQLTEEIKRLKAERCKAWNEVVDTTTPEQAIKLLNPRSKP